ncbi:hypothetical protein [Epilithonimonas hominis]|uniref:hypothetical protein n=1 Tax=Epilithonimonas hominis TaxID=420404 RepID=UPI00289C85C5|nr:hypothetical protein [Epilithonimonas hominis]
MKKIILLIIIFSLVSCVSFDKKMYQKDLIEINSENFEIINARYENNPVQRICCENFKEDLSKKNSCLKDYFIYNDKGSLPNCSQENNGNVSIVKQDKKYYLLLNYLDYENKLQEYKIEGYFSNGFFKLKNYNYIINGIPYIFGGAKITQARIGLDKGKNLLIENFTDNSGAFLLFFWAGNSGSFAMKFNRK